MLRRQLSGMAVAYVRHFKNTRNFEIVFHYRNVTVGIDRIFNFQRNIDETIETTLKRIQANVQKEFNKVSGGKKKKKPKTDQNEENQTGMRKVEIDLVAEKDDSTTWSNLLTKAETTDFDSIVLKVCEQEFQVTFNYPYVNQVLLPSVILTGFQCYPAKFEVFFTERESCSFEWYRGLPTANKRDSDIVWIKCDGSKFFYDVQSHDLGHKLKLVCLPRNRDKIGSAVEAISQNIVQSGPLQDPFKEKHAVTAKRLENNQQFRVVSYNLLADYYCDSDYSRKELFPYCPAYALEIDYRKLLFMHEMLGYNADIYCLQEVDAKVFDLDLTLYFGDDGLDGIMQKKGSNAEGIATFYRRNKFDLVDNFGINLNEQMEERPYFVELYDKIKKNTKLCKRMLSLATAVQVTVLKSKSSNQYLLVGNTHLYFHPDADHIRLLQMAFFMLFVKYIHRNTVRKFNLDPKQISIVFCGDFNSVPECGIFKLMTEKRVPENFIDFKSNKDEALSGVALAQPFDIQSAYGTPKYTNFTVGFADCLDYIFYQTDSLRVLQVAPLPTEQQLKAHTAIPSIIFPSDHVSLVADLEWIE